MQKTSRIHIRIILINSLTPLLLIGCGQSEIRFDPAAQRIEVEEWRASRLSRLTSEDGWLTLVGLSWLTEGSNSCGSAPDAQVGLPPGRAPSSLGTFLRSGGKVRFEAQPGVEVTVNDSAVASIEMLDDNHPDGPTIMRHGTLSLYVIRREDELAVRVKDSQSPTRLNFAGLDYFPIDPKWRITARFDPYSPPHVMEVPAAAGPPQTFTFTGSLRFEVDGKECRLDAAIEEGMEEKLFLMFADQTSGIETYGAGRQLYADLPDKENGVIIDFNMAYNWPCVFTEFATCPLTPGANILPIRVEAGERMPGNHPE